MTSWTWAANGASGDYNAAYDVWFSSGPGGDPATASSPSGGFLMVWFQKPVGAQPIGGLVPNGSVTLAGKTWSIWYGTNSSNGRPVVSYVVQPSINSLTFSLGDFIADALQRSCAGTTKCLQAGGALTNIFAGFEIWSGGVGIETTDFAVTVP
jgi:hypothetical protein